MYKFMDIEQRCHNATPHTVLTVRGLESMMR